VEVKKSAWDNRRGNQMLRRDFHLLRNMLNYMARDLDKPLADLPAGFDAQLPSLGYR
jgi:hypothetical protein